MANEFIYPTSQELMEIAPTKLAELTMDDPIFELFPIRNRNVSMLAWDQRDNHRGLQNVRGLGGKPGRVKRLGAKRFTYEPGAYGDFITIEEKEMTERAKYGTNGSPVDITDLVLEAQDLLLHRRINRIRWMLWQLMVYGRFYVTTETGGVVHTDSFDIRTFSPAVAWTTYATATPYLNFRQVALLSRGYSTTFGAGATAWMNQTTCNNMLQNLNANDLAGRRTGALNVVTALNLTDVNQILSGDGLATIKVYDKGYYDDNNVWQQFLPDNYVVWTGPRDNGDPIGEFNYTRNMNNEGGNPGPYQKVKVDTEDTPPEAKVEDGFNGGSIIWYPSSVLVGYVG